ncbi:MAG: iron-molybdenum cofactor biosynthesis protein [Firmicutes bacterium]|nr:iron-molybdenum cofactor biosynthesis protein [Bacillota bacterium]
MKKIAVSTADGVSICGHLGRVSKFFIYEVKDGAIVSKNLREVTPVHGSHERHNHDHNHNHHHHAGHGTLIDSLSDCSAVITNGMGGGMVAALTSAGMDPVITAESDPDTAVLAYLNGALEASEGCSHCSH